jgi:hypothetical protein
MQAPGQDNLPSGKAHLFLGIRVSPDVLVWFLRGNGGSFSLLGCQTKFNLITILN